MRRWKAPSSPWGASRASLELRSGSEPDAVFVDIRHDSFACEILCLKLIQSFAPSADLHIASSPFGDSFLQRFAAALRHEHQVHFYGAPEKLSVLAGLEFDSQAEAASGRGAISGDIRILEPSRWPG